MSSGERVWARDVDSDILGTKRAARIVKMSTFGAELRIAERQLPGDKMRKRRKDQRGKSM